MNIKFLLLLMVASFLSASSFLQAQIDSVIVEKYYISDANDATDITGGGLVSGSVTYRVYVDLAEGYKLRAIYGDEYHELSFSSTEYFFNNKSLGRSVGKYVMASWLSENTLALDSWITIGLASDTHSGVLKTEDNDGSRVGGSNNDGGSAHIPGGLLVNADPDAGIPLTTADGLEPATTLPTSWIYRLNGEALPYTSDTTIFGSRKQTKTFLSNDFMLSNSGVTGIAPNNRILVAQLTTTGVLSFKLNIEIEQKDDSGTRRIKFVSDNPTGEEKTSRFLIYPLPPPPPPLCGCKDPDYLEYNKKLELHQQDSCKTKIIFGCMDKYACNFDPEANYNIPSLCCYPGRCNNRDINVVCPGLAGNTLSFSVYPIPANDQLTVNIAKGTQKDILVILYDSNGTSVLTEKIGSVSDERLHHLDISFLQKGIYLLTLISDGKALTKTFIKN